MDGIIQNKTEAQNIFKELQLDSNVRGESLSIEQFAEIANYIAKIK